MIFSFKIKACEKFYRRHIIDIPRIKFFSITRRLSEKDALQKAQMPRRCVMNTFPLTARRGISARLLRALLLMLLSYLPISMAAALAEDGNNLIQGTVLETMDAAGYTYVNISSPEGPLWIAIPETRVSTGEQRSFAPGMEMKDFHSTSLNKTFASIIFSEGIVDVAASAKPDDSKASKLL